MKINFKNSIHFSLNSQKVKKILLIIGFLVFLGIAFLGIFTAYNFWRSIEGEVTASNFKNIKKKTIEDLLTTIKDKEDYSFLLKNKEGGKANPFLP